MHQTVITRIEEKAENPKQKKIFPLITQTNHVLLLTLLYKPLINLLSIGNIFLKYYDVSFIVYVSKGCYIFLFDELTDRRIPADGY